ncbi:MAG: peptidylprolyl isomerase [Christensenellaceae bacterium]
MKKIVLLCLCAVMVFAAAGCSMAFLNEERDSAQVVAEVNGVSIIKEELLEAFDMYTYQNVGTDFATYAASLSEDDAKTLQNSVLEDLIGLELLYQQAEKDGIVDNSDENRQAIKDEINKNLQSVRQSYEDSADADGLTGEEKDAWVKERYDEYVENAGYSDMEQVVDDRIRSNAITAMTEKLDAEVTYTEEQAKEFYDVQSESQWSLIQDDRSNYALYKSFGQVYAYPEDARYIKNLLIQIPEETKSEITSLRSEGNDGEADVLRDEALAEIKDKADEVLQRAKSGEDFDALVAEFGEDPGMQEEPAKTRGYVVLEDSEDYVAEFTAASLALENEGDVSDLVVTDYGYHILQYAGSAAGPIPFEDMKEDIISTNLATEQNSHYYDYIEKLKEASTIKKYTNRY